MSVYRVFDGGKLVATVTEREGGVRVTGKADVVAELKKRLMRPHTTMVGNEAEPGMFVDQVVTLKPGDPDFVEAVLYDSEYHVEEEEDVEGEDVEGEEEGDVEESNDAPDWWPEDEPGALIGRTRGGRTGS